MLNIRLNIAVDRHKSRTVQSTTLYFEKHFQLRPPPLATPLFVNILCFIVYCVYYVICIFVFSVLILVRIITVYRTRTVIL